jgi:DNA replication protein DnaC
MDTTTATAKAKASTRGLSAETIAGFRPEYQRLLDSLQDDFCPSCGDGGCDRVIERRLIRMNAAYGYEVECCTFEAVRLQNVEDTKSMKTVEQILAASNIPTNFADRSLDNWNQNTPDERKAYAIVRDYIDRFDTFRENGLGILFIGPPGTGKTHLLVAIVKAVIARGIYARYWFMPDLLSNMRPGGDGRLSSQEKMIRDEMCRLGLIALDDIGAEKSSEWVEQMYTLIVDERYRNPRPIIAATNWEIDELVDRLGQRVVDRLAERAVIVSIRGESYRPPLAPKPLPEQGTLNA